VSLVQEYRRLAEACPALDLAVGAPGPGGGPGWIDGAALAGDPAVLHAWPADEAARIGGAGGRPVRDDVVASRALHGYLWSTCLLISGPWYLGRRVPLLRPQEHVPPPRPGRRPAVPAAAAVGRRPAHRGRARPPGPRPAAVRLKA
jgi:hypothetical protein